MTTTYQVTRASEDTRCCHERAVKGRVYVWPAGETVIENLENRRSRPAALYRQMAREGLAKLGYKIEALRWSQTAGCSCGCSPGFVVDGLDYKDVHITFDAVKVAEEASVGATEAATEAMGRLDALLAAIA